MDANEFRKRGEELIDYLADYVDSVSERSVTPNVKPEYLFSLLPTTAPEEGESFETIMDDFEKHIMPGLVHWQNPHFHAYFPANSSYPSVLGEMMSDTFGCSNHIWNMCKFEQEIQCNVLTWLGKMIGLPDDFLPSSTDSVGGGGFVANSCSECIFFSVITARQHILERLQDKNPSTDPAIFFQSLVAYCSTEAHSAVEKATMVAMVTLRVLDTDENNRLRGETFAKAVEEDIKNGLIPFYVSITIGTTTCCACDPIDEIGPICKTNGIWLNVDGAYGGNALICPEYRHLSKGIEYASTVVINPVKWMLINCEGSVVWTKFQKKFADAYSVDSDLFNNDTEKFSYHPNRRFRALKLWFVIRNYGVEGLQKYIRHHIHLAKIFENYVKDDERFELFNSQFGLVCFRLKGSNCLNKNLLMAINSSHKLHLTGCKVKGKYIIRFCVCSKSTTEEDITYAWSVFCEFTQELLEAEQNRYKNA